VSSSSLLEEVREGLPGDLRDTYFGEGADRGVHLAVMREPYLSFLIGGSKTIESRFSVNRVDPFGRVHVGDLVLLKAGPVMGAFIVEQVDFKEIAPGQLDEVRDQFNDRILADSEFWDAKAGARFASLMKVRSVRSIPEFAVSKRDMRGWVVLRASHRDHVTLW